MDPKIISDNNIFTNEEKDIVEKEIIFSHRIPWYVNQVIENNPNQIYLSHTLIGRIENPNEHVSWSHWTEFFLPILQRFCEKHEILKNARVLRATINRRIPQYDDNYKYTWPHVDHQIPHTNFLMYLTDNEQGTFIYDKIAQCDPDIPDNITSVEEAEKLNVIHREPAEAFKIFCFDGLFYHSQEITKTDKPRIAVVITMEDLGED